MKYDIRDNKYLKNMIKLIYYVFKEYKISLGSIILYGNKSNFIFDFENDFDLYIFSDDDVQIKDKVILENRIRIELLKNSTVSVNCHVFSKKVFEEVTKNDKIIGTYFYILVRNGILIYDNKNFYEKIKELFYFTSSKAEEIYLQRCVKLSEYLGSKKWTYLWERKLKEVKFKNKSL